jgi:2-methylcitrate dehydratase
MTMDALSRRMADFALGLNYEDIPEPARNEAKRFLLDSLGCALAAVQNEDMQAMYRFTKKLGGIEEATVIGVDWRTNAPNAALMNGLLIRALDYNDIYWVQDPSHPSDLLGTALAAAEVNPCNGQDLITAIVLAYELEMRWCHAAYPGIREVGWHHATLTQFVSPLVAGKLYQLDRDQMIAALGISGSSHFTLGGVVAGHLTNMKNTADPLAAQAGIYAALMAREGYSGPVEVLEGKEGLFEVLSNVRWESEELFKGLGDDFLITTCSYKAFPTEALTHQPISAVLHLREEHKIDPSTIDEILVETTTRGADILSDPSKYQPDTKETADHSLPYVVAAAAAEGHVLPESFDDEKLFDPMIRELLPKIKVVANEEIDDLFPQVKRARVTIKLDDGQSFQHQTDIAKGDPADPMSDADLEAKFLANGRKIFAADRLDEIIKATRSLEEYTEIGSFLGLLTP